MISRVRNEFSPSLYKIVSESSLWDWRYIWIFKEDKVVELLAVQKATWNSGKKIPSQDIPKMQIGVKECSGKVLYSCCAFRALSSRYPLLAVVTNRMFTWLKSCWPNTAVLRIHQVSVVEKLALPLNPPGLIIVMKGTGAAPLCSFYQKHILQVFSWHFLIQLNQGKLAHVPPQTPYLRISPINHKVVWKLPQDLT